MSTNQAMVVVATVAAAGILFTGAVTAITNYRRKQAMVKMGKEIETLAKNLKASCPENKTVAAKCDEAIDILNTAL